MASSHVSHFLYWPSDRKVPNRGQSVSFPNAMRAGIEIKTPPNAMLIFLFPIPRGEECAARMILQDHGSEEDGGEDGAESDAVLASRVGLLLGGCSGRHGSAV